MLFIILVVHAAILFYFTYLYNLILQQKNMPMTNKKLGNPIAGVMNKTPNVLEAIFLIQSSLVMKLNKFDILIY